jgi:Domain of Unknown Function (DUF930)
MRQLALAIGVVLLAGACATAAENRFEHSLRRLSPGERLVQLCDYTAMQRVRHDSRKYRPDRAVADARGEVYINKNTVVAKGGAFRSRHKWYALSFTCTASPDNMKVLTFKYTIGGEIPEAKWAAYRLWE